MFTIVILSVLCSSVALYFTVRAKARSRFDMFWNALWAVIFSAAASAVVSAILAAALSGFLPDILVPDQTNLFALSTDTSPRGTFVLGFGDLSTDLQYRFYYQNPDKSMSPGLVSADSSIEFFEDPSLTNTGTWIKQYREKDSSSWFAKFTLPSEHDLFRQEFHVPVGSVIHKFNIDK